MRNSTKIGVAVALIASTIMVAAASIDYSSSANAAALPFAGTPGEQTPIRATKGDRHDARPEFRRIAGVTVVLRDFGRVVR